MISLPLRVALVDDDTSVRRALGRVLQSAHFDVEAYPSGKAFLRSVNTFQPHCVILDLHMPELTGLDVQRQLQNCGSSVPVVVITGHDNAKDRDESMRLGAKAYFDKPLDGDLLIETVKRLGTGNRCSL